MDVDYILERERESLMRSSSAASPEARCAHAGLARGYGAMLTGEPFPPRVRPPTPAGSATGA